MKRTILTFAAIVAAIAIYDRTAATSSEPLSRTVSGGPTVVFIPFSDAFWDDDGTYYVVAQTDVLTFEQPVTVIVDARMQSGCSSASFWLRRVDGGSLERGFRPGHLDFAPTADAASASAGHAHVLPAGSYTYLAEVQGGFCGAGVGHAEGWLRLQIWGCDSPAGCIPGDLNLDGRVNLLDFAILANNFQG